MNIWYFDDILVIIFDSIQTRDRTLLFSFYLLNIQCGGFVNRVQINSFFKFRVIQLIQFRKIKFFEYFLCIGIDTCHVDKSTVIDVTGTSGDLLGKSENLIFFQNKLDLLPSGQLPTHHLFWNRHRVTIKYLFLKFMVKMIVLSDCSTSDKHTSSINCSIKKVRNTKIDETRVLVTFLRD